MTAEAEIHAHLEEVDEAHKTRDMKRLIKTYSPDATLITAGVPPIHGRDAIEKFYINFYNNFPSSGNIPKTEVKEINVNGDFATVLGAFSSTSQGTTVTGNFVNVLKRLADGKWYTHHDIFTMETQIG